MKKLDKLILTSFIGPFLLTFVVVVFILLNQHMLKYFDDIIGKDLGFEVLSLLFFYFAIFMIPMALPLAILLSSLITFSALGEHSELTAVKGLGVSALRSLASLFAVVMCIVGLAFLVNNYLVPKAALEAYSLLYDIKQKKPALDLRPGVFYNAIPGISIKANEKFPDGQTLKDIIIYDSREEIKARNIIVADSGKMYTRFDGRYLEMDLFDGYNYTEGSIQKSAQGDTPTLSKTAFSSTRLIFDLSSFGLTRSDKRWFEGHRIMRNLGELDKDIDSIRLQALDQRLQAFYTARDYLFTTPNPHRVALPRELAAHKVRKDSASVAAGLATAPYLPPPSIPNPYLAAARAERYRTLMTEAPSASSIERALEHARQVKDRMLSYTEPLHNTVFSLAEFEIQWHKILASSFACLSMFLIGAPLGSIIRKGGLGIPVLISIIFFILFYVLTIMGEKWAKQGAVSVEVGAWLGNTVLLSIGAFILSRARADTRLLDNDLYHIWWDKIKTRLARKT